MRIRLRIAAILCIASTTAAFVPVVQPKGSIIRTPVTSSLPLWKSSSRIQDKKVTVQFSASGAFDAFEEDEKGWKATESNFISQRTYNLKSGIFRLPGLADLSSTLPPVSRLHKLKNFIFRSKPIYDELNHEDYVEACRSLGVSPDVDEAALDDKVQQLMVKYEKDRKKKIMIDWAHDKVLEHRLFVQLDGGAQKPPGLDLRLLDERNYDLTERDTLDLMTALDLGPEDVRKSKPGPFSFLVNNPITRLLGIKKVLNTVTYVLAAMKESYEGPNLGRLFWPGAFCLGLSMFFGSSIDSLPGKYLINIIAQFPPIYNRGEAAVANRREQRPIKWRKIFLSLSFMGIVNALAYGIGKAWIALKYPTLDLPEPQFILTLAQFMTYLAASSFFIRESTLAAGESGKRRRRSPDEY